MSDQYTPPRPDLARPDTADRGAEPDRRDVRCDGAAPAKSGGGFASGMLVAVVFVVVAVLAAVLFGNRDSLGFGAEDAPAVTIENNTAPAASTADPDVAPAPVIPDPAPDVVPEEPVVPSPDVTPDAGADTGAADPVAPANP